jgi:ferredoxin
MSQEISLQELIAANSTAKARAMVVKFGYKPARNLNDLTDKLYAMTSEYQDEALKEMAKIHPHKDLILHYLSEEKKEEPKSGCDGSSCSCNKEKKSRFEYADEYIDFIGTNKAVQKETSPKDYLPLVAVAGLFALAIVTMSK